MKANMISLGSEKTAAIELNEAVFGLAVRKDILQRVVEWQRAKKQAGTHKTKQIGEISGTTKKPFRQKGTGNARQGSLRSPHMRGGAVIFGPVVRSHAHSLNKKIRVLGLKTALSAKQAEGKLHILGSSDAGISKAKDVSKKLNEFGFKSVLFIDGSEVNNGFAKAARNLKYVDVLPSQGANVYDILRHEHLVLTVDAVKQLEERLV